MDISSVIAASSSQPQSAKRPGDKNALQATINSLILGNKKTSLTSDIASLSLAAKLQAGTQNLRQVSGNLAEATSLTQVADQGIGKIESALKTLQTLAKQAENPQLSAEKRAQLANQFKEVAAGIDKAVDTTTFNDKRLLNGDLTGKNVLSLKGALTADAAQIEGVALSIENISSASLFNGKTLDISSPEKAKEALSALTNALKKVTDIRTQVGEFRQLLDYASANIDSAVANQTAAESLLKEIDFTAEEGSGQFSLVELLKNVDAALALKAQGNLFNPTLLKLVS